MKEIVINSCFGGFSLSALGVKAYYAKKGIDAVFYKHMPPHGLKRIAAENAEGMFWHAYSRDLGDVVTYTDEGYLTARDMPRDDPDLAATVKELGAKANGECARLSIVEIPDGVDWEIDEYDGRETVEEKHRTWR